MTINIKQVITLLHCFCAGSLMTGLKCHPGRHHLVYGVGSTVVVENIETRKQDFLVGHTNTVSCIDISKSGRFIASGQVTYSGFKVIIFLKFLICGVTFNLSKGLLQISFVQV